MVSAKFRQPVQSVLGIQIYTVKYILGRIMDSAWLETTTGSGAVLQVLLNISTMNRASGIGLYVESYLIFIPPLHICIMCVQGGRKCIITCTLVQVKSYQCPYKTSTIDVFLKFCCQRMFKNKNISFNINRAIPLFL